MSSKQPVTRTLTAILHADIVGFSRLMGEDETGTHAAVRSEMARAELVVGSHGGRIVNTAGDAFLAVFPSVNGALRAALEFQAGGGQGNAQKISFRIGLNSGDVIESDGDVFGEGVNIAARVQALAAPGGIAVTNSVRAQVSRDIGVVFDEIGRKTLKNIAEPVHVFTVRTGEPGSAAPTRAFSRRWVFGGMGLAAIVLAIIAATLFWPADRTVREAAFEPPTVAVLPFRDRSIPPNADYFSEGITEDIIGLLGRFPELLILSWNAVAAITGDDKEADVDALGADYIVGGSIQRSDDRLRASVQLSDAGNGRLLWSETYDQPITDIFVIQDEISRAVVEALSVRIERLERKRADVADPDRLSAYDFVLRGRSLMHVPTRDKNLEARAAFDEALALDPVYAAAHVGIGWTYRADFLWGWSHDPQQSVTLAERHARAAIAADAQNASAHALLADVERFFGEMTEAKAAIERALDLNPSDPIAQAIHGSMLLFAGDAAGSIPPLETARRLDPALPSWTIANLARAYYFQTRYLDAVAVVSDATVNMGEDPAGYAVQAAAEAQLGDVHAAQRTADKVRQIYPFFDAEIFVTNVAPADDTGHLLDGLRKAGL